MNPETRQMLGVTVDNALEVDDTFSTLMGELVAPRKSFIQAHARSVQNLDVSASNKVLEYVREDSPLWNIDRT